LSAALALEGESMNLNSGFDAVWRGSPAVTIHDTQLQTFGLPTYADFASKVERIACMFNSTCLIPLYNSMYIQNDRDWGTELKIASLCVLPFVLLSSRVGCSLLSTIQ